MQFCLDKNLTVSLEPKALKKGFIHQFLNALQERERGVRQTVTSVLYRGSWSAVLNTYVLTKKLKCKDLYLKKSAQSSNKLIIKLRCLDGRLV